MIYQLVEAIRQAFPAVVVYANVYEEDATQPQIPDQIVLVSPSGGPSAPWFKFTRATYHILVRDISAPAAEQLADEIWHTFHGNFGLVLPAVNNVNGVNYPEIQTAQISAVQRPGCIGADAAGRIQYSMNFIVIYVEVD